MELMDGQPEPGERPTPGRRFPAVNWSAVVLVLVTAILLLRNLALDAPLMPGDEYAYQAAAQTFPRSGERFSSDPYLPRIYSPVFAAYGHILFSFSDRPDLLLKTLNILAFICVTVIYLALARRIGAARRLLTASVLVLIPTSAYTAYFMPEATYSFCFALLAGAVVTQFPRRILAGAAGAGVVVGTMLLIKPHALALFVAVPLTMLALAASPSALRQRRGTIAAASGVFVLAAYLTLVVINVLLSGQLELHPLTFVGDIYRPYLSRGASPTVWLEKPHQLISILGGHVIVLGALLAPALAMGTAHLHRLYAVRAEPSRSGRERTLLVLILFAAMVTLTTVGMTTVFTMVAAQSTPTEHLRIHGRYYSFFLPLYLILFLGTMDDSDERLQQWLRGGAVVGCLMALLLLFVHGRRVIYPYDFPEAFVFSSWADPLRIGQQRLAGLMVQYGAVAAAVGTYSLVAWRGRRAAVLYPALLIGLFAASSLGVSAWQRLNSSRNLILRADARAMRQLIPAAQASRGVVVGPEWNGALAYFLFNYQASPRVLVHDPGVRLTRTEIPEGTPWVVLLGDYELDVPAAVSWRTREAVFVGLAPQAGGQ
jgi:hypothetical protein